MNVQKEFLCECIKCKHKWIKRTLEEPKQCPKCKQYEWKSKEGDLGWDVEDNKVKEMEW